MKRRLAIAALVVAVASLAFVDVGRATNGGSMSFNGTNQYVSVAGSSDWAVGTGDFTVEWFQYQTSFSSNWPRIFTVGTYPASIGVSIEGGTMYVWLAGNWRLSASVGTISNQWVHFAVTRSGTTLRIYKNGTELATGTNSSNVTNSSTSLFVGSESTSGTYFGGLITNFHFVKGSALYTSAFIPNGPIVPVANTKLLLLATDASGLLTDSSSIGRTVTNVNSTAFNWGTPFPWTGTITATSVPATSPPATTTTTTTLAPTTSTVAPTTSAATTTTSSIASTSTTSVAPSPTSTIAPASTVASNTQSSNSTTPISKAPSSTVTATTTRPSDTTVGTTSRATTTTPLATTTTIPAPSAPEAKTGEVGVSIGGVLVDADLKRVNNELVVTAGGAKVVLGALNSDGSRKGLSDSGSLDLESGEAMSVRVEGFASEAEAQFWLFSDPILLDETTANDSGRVAADVSIPDDVEPGEHRFVLASTNSDGEPVNLSVGINVLPVNDGGIRWEILLAFLVLGLGGLAALFLPAVLRRRAE